MKIFDVNMMNVAFNFECNLIGFPRQESGLQSEEYKAFPLYTLY
jgi:hypothetical protein